MVSAPGVDYQNNSLHVTLFFWGGGGEAFLYPCRTTRTSNYLISRFVGGCLYTEPGLEPGLDAGLDNSSLSRHFHLLQVT